MLGALAFNQAMARHAPSSGEVLDADKDQPMLPDEQVAYGGSIHSHSASLHAVWLSQRARGYFQAQSAKVQSQVEDMLGAGTLIDLLRVPLRYRIERMNNRLTIQ